MKFITRQNNLWQTQVGEDGPIVTLTPKPYSLLNLSQWQGVRSHWPSDMPVALDLANDVDIHSIAIDLPRLGMISLQFPKWVDGRAYTQARMLRKRFQYRGEIRATMEVLVDMLPLLARTGFDAVVLRGDQQLAHAQKALSYFSDVGFYQADTLEAKPRFLRHPEESL